VALRVAVDYKTDKESVLWPPRDALRECRQRGCFERDRRIREDHRSTRRSHRTTRERQVAIESALRKVLYRGRNANRKKEFS
ncbi:hypothetical protein, partial [Burkholderia glumae]|uniref:hypothetical protein n=1 Tax=Burkholderia glumae TaxID=337 RepID=UPI001E33BAB3